MTCPLYKDYVAVIALYMSVLTANSTSSLKIKFVGGYIWGYIVTSASVLKSKPSAQYYNEVIDIVDVLEIVWLSLTILWIVMSIVMQQEQGIVSSRETN